MKKGIPTTNGNALIGFNWDLLYITNSYFSTEKIKNYDDKP